MKRKSRAERLSDDFLAAAKAAFSDLSEPDKEHRDREAPDIYLREQNILMELKSIAPNIGAGNSIAQQVRWVKRDRNIHVYGTVSMEFDQVEASRFSEKLTGRLRKSIKKADSQLNNFIEESEILTVLAVFVEVTDAKVREWNSRSLPTRNMVRQIVYHGMKDHDIDAFLIFTLDDANKICLDLMRLVYSDELLEREFGELVSVLSIVCPKLPYEFDFSERPVFFEEAI